MKHFKYLPHRQRLRQVIRIGDDIKGIEFYRWFIRKRNKVPNFDELRFSLIDDYLVT